MAELEKEEMNEGVTEDMTTEGDVEETTAENAEDSAAEDIEETEKASEDAAEENEQPEDGEASGAEPKKGIFKKKEKKDKKDEQIEELNDRLRRQMAEFDNFRKRSEKEKTQMFDMGASTIVEKILPVIDSFERGLAAVSEEEKENPFVQGMDKVYKQMTTALAEVGVTPIEAAGAEFDPNLHNAVMHVEDETLGENVVAEELQKGYMYKETVVRHSMVKVAN